ncbi:hypothetical protein HYFRA_00012314 [Hymenoscyphus fraxineus]|uniref:Small ribosomal subunit protein mS38 n=1 Tax=Hymenoscyphus fraxineus TaxID=746836 RepID=A0A9N9L0G9_9HELO|nr:hypothetical protein HYFRA_00012314 [Hymenoscyphus fraxineus]
MFSSSIRRVASKPPSIPIASSFASCASRAAAAHALSTRIPQRRYSSSKPSSPADGSKGVAQSGPTTAIAQKGSRSSKKKNRDGNANGKGKEEPVDNLPSVPSTQHIAPNQISASDFFSLHRPISLTHSFPQAVTDEAFASIFAPRSKSNLKPAEVISTLSRTVENLDTVTSEFKKMSVVNPQDWSERDELRAAITAESNQRMETQHLDSPPEESAMSFPQHILSGKYRPFSLPPAPMPMNTPESIAAGAEAAAEAQETQHRTYTAVLTIEESTDQNGDVTYHAHSSPLVSEDQPASTRFLERMQARQDRYRVQRGVELNGMFAISVKRQRKLKMKKHKYKKLMRRTRNLRRRLDRN